MKNECIILLDGYAITIHGEFSVRILHWGSSIAQPMETCHSRAECLAWARLYFREKGAEYAARSTLMYSISNHPSL